eukprot:scaffold14698_cov135-Isochrysis_galbana.AAC.3
MLNRQARELHVLLLVYAHMTPASCGMGLCCSRCSSRGCSSSGSAAWRMNGHPHPHSSQLTRSTHTHMLVGGRRAPKLLGRPTGAALSIDLNKECKCA